MTRWHQERAVYYFVKVAQARSFTQAAQALRMAQPNLSAIVSRLEKDLGRPLFLRPATPLRLTLAGEKLLAAATPMVAEITQVDTLLTQLRNEQDLTVRIAGNAGTVDVPERQALVDRFMAASPAAQLRHLEFAVGDEFAGARRENADFLFSFMTPPPGYTGLLLARRRLMFLVPAEHAIARHASIPLQMLAGHAVLDWTRSAESRSGMKHWAVMAPLAEVGARLIPSPEFNNRGNLRYAARARLILPYFEFFLHLPEIPPDMKLVALAGTPITCGFFLSYAAPPQRRAACAFWACAREIACST